MGARGRPCKICIAPELKSQVDAQLLAGETYSAIASAAGLNKFAVARHRKHAFPDVANTEGDNLSENKLATLYDRCEQLFVALAASGDSKAASEIVKIQARLAEQMASREEAKKEAATDTGRKSGPTVEQIDELLRDYRKQHQQQIDRGLVSCPCCQTFGALILPQQIKDRMPAILAAAEGAGSDSPEKMEVVHNASNFVSN